LECAFAAAAPENRGATSRRTGGGRRSDGSGRRQLELDRGTVEKKEPLDNEVSTDLAGDLEEDAPRIGRMNEMMQGVGRQATFDLGNDLGL
jgi:hypothetical protein